MNDDIFSKFICPWELPAEDECLECFAYMKPAAAPRCRVCEDGRSRDRFLATARGLVPAGFQSAKLVGEQVTLGDRAFASPTTIARVREMFDGSGIVRGDAIVAGAILAAIFHELIDAARLCEVRNEADWKTSTLVRRASLLRWYPAFMFDEACARGEARSLDGATRASVLVVQDLEPNVLTPAGASLLNQTIRRRIHEGRPTIVTTGAMLADIARRFGSTMGQALVATHPVLDLGVDGVVRDAKVDRNPALHLVGRGSLPGAK
jgi:hypothetical protein